MNKIKSLLVIIAGMLITLVFAAPANLALAAIKDDIQEGSCGASGQTACDSGAATTSINNTISSIINIMSVVIGVVAVVIIIVAGFRYITSAGNEQAIAAAKKTLIYALVGLVIVALAQVIVRFVLSASTNTSATGSSNQSPGSSAGGIQGNNIPQ